MRRKRGASDVRAPRRAPSVPETGRTGVPPAMHAAPTDVLPTDPLRGIASGSIVDHAEMTSCE